LNTKVRLFFYFIVIIFSIYNLTNLLKNHTSGVSNSLSEFIDDNTDMKIINNSELNLYFIVTPIDCDCLRFFTSTYFIKKMRASTEKKSISINYIVSGDYKKSELEEYVNSIKDGTDRIYFDENNKAKMFLFQQFRTFRTPFVIILNKNGIVRYWQPIMSTVKPDKIYQDLIKILEVIL